MVELHVSEAIADADSKVVVLPDAKSVADSGCGSGAGAANDHAEGSNSVLLWASLGNTATFPAENAHHECQQVE